MGVHHRVLNVARQLKKCGHVTFLQIARPNELQATEAMRHEFRDVIVMDPARYEGPAASGWLREELCRHWPTYYGDKVKPADRERFLQLYEQHDIVWFHTLPAADCFGKLRFDRSVMDIDDLNHIKYRLRCRDVKPLRKKLANKLLELKWRRRERDVLKRFTAMAVCSEQDKRYLNGDPRIHVIPNGFDAPASKPVYNAEHNFRLGFIGSLGYEPNADGLLWFIRDVLPIILKKVPQAKLEVVGKVPENFEFLDHPWVEFCGYVDDVSEKFAGWAAMVVPLHQGGGTRVKILEAFSRMCPVVSTGIGAYGLDVTDDKELLLADLPDRFAESCLELLSRPDYGERLVDAAWNLFERKYTWDIIGEAIEAAVLDCLRRSGGVRSR